MKIRNWNEIIGKNGIRIEIEIFFQNGNNTGVSICVLSYVNIEMIDWLTELFITLRYVT